MRQIYVQNQQVGTTFVILRALQVSDNMGLQSTCAPTLFKPGKVQNTRSARETLATSRNPSIFHGSNSSKAPGSRCSPTALGRRCRILIPCGAIFVNAKERCLNLLAEGLQQNGRPTPNQLPWPPQQHQRFAPRSHFPITKA